MAETNSVVAGADPSEIDCICVGSGRFLRSVLVPALNGANLKSAIFQTRGRTFLDHCLQRRRQAAEYGHAVSTEDPSLTYELDTVGFDGNVTTEEVKCYGAGTLGSKQGKADALALIGKMKRICLIGVGVTEAGLESPKSQALIDLADLLYACYMRIMANNDNLGNQLTLNNPNGRISVVNTDNVPKNGQVIQRHLLDIAYTMEANGTMAASKVNCKQESGFVAFLKDRIVFHDTMVDRITSQRMGSDGMVPRCEPVPAKALVIEDLAGDLPPAFLSETMISTYGVVVRKQAGKLDSDIALKLRVANGTHTAAAQTMAISSLLMTDILSHKSKESELLMSYVDSFFSSQILPAASDAFGNFDCLAAYDDWRKRLIHPHFGLSSFFITQNAAAKGGIRLSPTIESLLQTGKPLTVSTAFAVAAILRFLTPSAPQQTNGVYRGWLDAASLSASATHAATDEIHAVAYADNLKYSLEGGWYEFRCACEIKTKGGAMVPLSSFLFSKKSTSSQPVSFEHLVNAYFRKHDGGNLQRFLDDDETPKGSYSCFVRAVSTLYARMIGGDSVLKLLEEMSSARGVYADGLDSICSVLTDGVASEKQRVSAPLHYRPNPIPNDSHLLNAGVGTDPSVIKSVVFAEVSAGKVIDLHTHLLPPSHGSLCLWGIDELLTYHYLVAEYFMTAPPDVTPEGFYQRSKRDQADMIWAALFVDRSPISEACRGVITTLQAFGLHKEIQERDLKAIRDFYDTFRSNGLAGTERFTNLVYEVAGVSYTIMTNIPFDANEAQHWRPKRKDYPSQFKSALRVDPLLAGDRKTIEAALRGSGYEVTLEGARQYLRDWCDTMKPEYMMASTPHNFVLKEESGPLSGVTKVGLNEDALKEPFAFTDEVTKQTSQGCIVGCEEGDDIASIIDENSDFLSDVLMAVCEERDLPVALKIGAHRGVNPKLLAAGDGMVAFADANVLARLCSRFPKVRFLATFLSRNNQHEACVLASKFRNFHLYGCWWYCNNPSLIREITTMRIEMLGMAFTAQHSDARVMDQLVYKWSHSRAIVANVLSTEYIKLMESGWALKRSDIRRDVRNLFGGSFQEFMARTFK